MSYQVLARKWRPKSFKEMVGQEHVLKALIHALEHQRLHHAYLFTGTRGVGKTTIGRILAKCLNCETGIVSVPCGQCSTCTEVNEGRFVDLIEIDAASRTKVEDMRELLDNVQYSPTRGRFKVYLIDEVHMLSTSSFNALLKTLEEPPEHVKFLLATTDPQKLPVTILSRCLQFNLKNMAPERIVGHLAHILTQESIPYEENALWLLARSADGSMRDALSLTDQSIAYGNGAIKELQVSEMLGTVGHKQILSLVNAIASIDAKQVLAAIDKMSEFSPDYDNVLSQLISVFHRIAIEQAVPGATDNTFGDEKDIVDLARALRAEDVQVFYQIALVSRKDLAITPDRRAGFEMALLRMIAFRPNIKSKSDVAPLKKQELNTDDETQLPQAPSQQSVAAVANLAVGGNQASESKVEVREYVQTEHPHMSAQSETVEQSSAVAAPKPQVTPDPQATPEVQQAPQSEPAAIIEPSASVEQATHIAPSSNVEQPTKIPHETGQEQSSSVADYSGLDQAVSAPPPGHPAYAGEEVPLPDNVDAYEIDEEIDGYVDTSTVGSGVESTAEAQKKTLISDEIPASVDDSLAGNDVEPADDAANSLSHAVNAPEMPPPSPVSAEGFDWLEDIDKIGLTGMTLNLASNCSIQFEDNLVQLSADEGNFRLLTSQHQKRIIEAITQVLGSHYRVEFLNQAPDKETPAQRKAAKKAKRLEVAVDAIKTDVNVVKMVEMFGASVIEKTVEPID